MSNPLFLTIAHVQLAMPAGGEDTARRFFVALCGMTEIPKPTELAKRGGCWFRSGQVEIHLGVEQDFRPAAKAHPALICDDYDALIVGSKPPTSPSRKTSKSPEPAAATSSICLETASS